MRYWDPWYKWVALGLFVGVEALDDSGDDCFGEGLEDPSRVLDGDGYGVS